ncbi:MAG TPA: hypothetical protein VMW48_11005, partial [Vicinamibacterales bacterium]|nr:hypothetical protein [Vicinamibacterales bacterium]
MYLAGSFTTLDGQPRLRLGAVSVATGALLPWAPQASTNVDVTVAPTGSVFVSGYGLSAGQGGTINGQTRTGGLFQIDAAGAVTPFELQVVTDNASVATFSGGALIISGSSAVTAATARHGVAAFDATTGALLPLAVTLQGLAGDFPPEVRQLVADGQNLHVVGTFTGVNGATRAGGASIDASSGALLPAWSLTGLRLSGLGPVINGWLYLTAAPDLPNMFVPELRRVNSATGVFDPGWRPALPNITQMFAAGGELLVVSALTTPSQGTIGTILSAVDQTTGAVREEFRTTVAEVGPVLVDGGTAYVLSRDLANNYGPFEYGGTVFAFDRATAVPVARPPVSGRIYAFALADGRVVLGGRNLSSASVERYGLMELSRTGTPTAWDGGYAPLGPYAIPGGAPGGVVRVDVRGDLLVTVGAMAGATRLAAFPLSGSTAPSGLRTRALGDQVQFTWDAATQPPAGGYVLEG